MPWRGVLWATILSCDQALQLAFGIIQPLTRRSSHLLLEVPEKEAELEGWTEEDFLNRLKLLGDETSTKLLLSQVEMFRGNGNQEGIRDIAEGVRRRLFDLSAFIKELKQRFYRRQAALCSQASPVVDRSRGQAVRVVQSAARAGRDAVTASPRERLEKGASVTAEPRHGDKGTVQECLAGAGRGGADGGGVIILLRRLCSFASQIHARFRGRAVI